MSETKSYMGNPYQEEEGSKLEGILEVMDTMSLSELKDLLEKTQEAILDLQILETLSIIESNEA